MEYVANSCSKGFFLDSESVNSHFMTVYEKQFLKNYSEDISIDMELTNESLKSAAEMFIYLNSCPGTVKPWILFYDDLFSNTPLHKILLSLNRILKGKKKHMQRIASKLFLKLEKQFSMHFRHIQNIINGIHNSSMDFRDVWTSKFFRYFNVWFG